MGKFGLSQLSQLVFTVSGIQKNIDSHVNVRTAKMCVRYMD